MINSILPICFHLAKEDVSADFFASLWHQNVTDLLHQLWLIII